MRPASGCSAMSQQRHQQQQQAPIIYDGDAFLPFRRKLRKLFDNIKYVPAPHVTRRWGACLLLPACLAHSRLAGVATLRAGLSSL